MTFGKQFARSVRTKSLLVILVLIMVVLVFMQYQWFCRSATAEVQGALLHLRGLVMQTGAREYQQYLPLLQDLGTVKVNGPSIETILEVYGPGTENHPLLLSIKDLPSTDPSALITSLDGRVLNLPRDGQRDKRPVLVYSVDSRGNPGLIVDQGFGRESRRFMVTLNQEGFFKEYLESSLLETLPGYKVEFETIPLEDVFPRLIQPRLDRNDLRFWEDRLGETEYTFNPFLVLLGKGAIIDPSKGLVLPLWSYFPEMFRVAYSPDAQGMTQVIRIIPGPEASITQLQMRLALNWLLSLVLMMVTGLALVLVILQADRMAKAYDDERSFVASVTHELRTPLTVIQAAADNMATGVIGPERISTYGALLQGESRRLGRMIEEVLAFSRLEGAKKQPTMLAEISLVELVQGVVSPLQDLASQKSINLKVDILGLPETFKTNPDSIRLILENLVLNSINHAYGGQVASQEKTIRVLMRATIPHGLVLVVEDDGRGILRQEQKKVFSAFYRDSHSVATQERGSGLGLYLVSQHVRLLGWYISLESPYRRMDGQRSTGVRITVGSHKQARSFT